MRGEGRDERPIAVLSDTHFGHRSATLRDPRMCKQLADELRRVEPGRIILLGDILDLWCERFPNAHADARHFFREITGLCEDLNSKLIYVIGNHDHHLKVIDRSIEGLPAEMGRRLKESFFPYRLDELREANLVGNSRIDAQYYYPEYGVEFCGKKILFTHGHYLTRDQQVVPEVFWMLNRLWRLVYRKKYAGHENMEPDLTTFYEMMYWPGQLEGVQERRHWLARGFAYLSGAGKLDYGEIRRELKDYLSMPRDMEKASYMDPDCVVFGHTHKGEVKGMHEKYLVNTGCWCTHGRNVTDDSVNNYVLIGKVGEHAKVERYKLGRKGVLDSFTLK